MRSAHKTYVVNFSLEREADEIYPLITGQISKFGKLGKLKSILCISLHRDKGFSLVDYSVKITCNQADYSSILPKISYLRGLFKTKKIYFSWSYPQILYLFGFKHLLEQAGMFFNLENVLGHTNRGKVPQAKNSRAFHCKLSLEIK